MTGEEMERAIAFVLQQQARTDARLADLAGKLGVVSEAMVALIAQAHQTDQRLGALAQQVIDWHGTPLGCAERPAYARPGWDPGPSPAGVAPLH